MEHIRIKCLDNILPRAHALGNKDGIVMHEMKRLYIAYKAERINFARVAPPLELPMEPLRIGFEVSICTTIGCKVWACLEKLAYEDIASVHKFLGSV